MPRHRAGFFRRLLTLVLATGGIGALAVAGTGTPGHAATAPPRPNVVVIQTDDQKLESMRVMDNVSSLIGGPRGTTFRRSFVNYSLCCPSRATFLTGQYMHNHGVLGNTPPNGGFERFDALHADNNLAVWLQDAGYYTAMVGKYLNGYPGGGMPAGWSEWYAAATNEQGVYNYGLNENGARVRYGSDPADFKQDVLTRKAVGFVHRRAPAVQPFFLWLTYTAPHDGGPDPSPNPPFNCHGAAKPAPRHAHAFDAERMPMRPNFNEANVSDKPAKIQRRPLLKPHQIEDMERRYRCELESLLSVDDGVKKVVDALRAAGELSNTVLMYTSDNGYFHGEHRIPRHKQHIYEASIRVPLLIRGPGAGFPRGVRVSDPVINADLAPTIVDLADAIPGLVMDGQSLIPVADQPGIGQGRELLIEQPSFKAIRTERYMYAEHTTGEKELYDLDQDPYELRSRDGNPDYALVEAQLAAHLQQLRNCLGSSCLLHSAP